MIQPKLLGEQILDSPPPTYQIANTLGAFEFPQLLFIQAKLLGEQILETTERAREPEGQREREREREREDALMKRFAKHAKH